MYAWNYHSWLGSSRWSRSKGATGRRAGDAQDSAQESFLYYFLNSFTQRYEAGRGQAQGRMPPKARKEMKRALFDLRNGRRERTLG